MVRVDFELTPEALRPCLARLFETSATKIRLLEKTWNPRSGPPVITVRGQYNERPWTDWTRGFQYGSMLLQFDATGDAWCLARARRFIPRYLSAYAHNAQVHDHGFNIASTFGNLWRLAQEGKFEASRQEVSTWRRVLTASGNVQASRWAFTDDERGYIYSFNGPHSLFVDTLRSLRSLALGYLLSRKSEKHGHHSSQLLSRLLQHAAVTADFAVYYGEGRDVYDIRGRVAHESLFDPLTGRYLCPSTQQGYSPFSTWMRGLSWALLGFVEQAEFLRAMPATDLAPYGGHSRWEAMMLRAARATAEFYLEQTPTDGIPYWDSGAPGLARLGDYRSRPADPFNDYEPVDSSAATIAAQGLWRLGAYLSKFKSNPAQGRRYRQAALTIVKTLLQEPYLSRVPSHQGLILHSIYHRPRGWDFVPRRHKIPCGESSMWGDYHAREMGLILLRHLRGDNYLTFFGDNRAER